MQGGNSPGHPDVNSGSSPSQQARKRPRSNEPSGLPQQAYRSPPSYISEQAYSQNHTSEHCDREVAGGPPRMDGIRYDDAIGLLTSRAGSSLDVSPSRGNQSQQEASSSRSPFTFAPISHTSFSLEYPPQSPALPLSQPISIYTSSSSSPAPISLVGRTSRSPIRDDTARADGQDELEQRDRFPPPLRASQHPQLKQQSQQRVIRYNSAEEVLATSAEAVAAKSRPTDNFTDGLPNNPHRMAVGPQDLCGSFTADPNPIRDVSAPLSLGEIDEGDLSRPSGSGRGRGGGRGKTGSNIGTGSARGKTGPKPKASKEKRRNQHSLPKESDGSVRPGSLGHGSGSCSGSPSMTENMDAIYMIEDRSVSTGLTPQEGGDASFKGEGDVNMDANSLAPLVPGRVPAKRDVSLFPTNSSSFAYDDDGHEHRNLEPGSAPAQELTAIQYQRQRDTKERARMGTRVVGSGSGGIGGGGYRYRMNNPFAGGSNLRLGQGVHGSVGGGEESRAVDQDAPDRMDQDGCIGTEECFEGEECFLWTDLPMCKQGFRYVPCSPSPNESPSSLTHPFYRSLCQPSGPVPALPFAPRTNPGTDTPPPVHLDWLDRSAYLKLSASAMTVTTEKGFRSVRGNVSVRRGAWYFEVIIERAGGEGCVPGGRIVDSRGARTQVAGANAGQIGYGHTHSNHSNEGQYGGSQMSDGAHVRLGWARREASLNGPCGLDGYSYGVRDSTGDKVTISRPKPYGSPFGSGDVIGCLLYIPELDEEELIRKRAKAEMDEWDPSNIVRKRIAIRYKDQLYFEMIDYPTTKEMDAMIERDGKAAPIAPVLQEMIARRESNGSAFVDSTTLQSRKALGSPAKKAKAPGASTKNTVDGKVGKAVKRGRKAQHDENIAAATEVRCKPILPGSRISFFLNGQPMHPTEPAFTDIFDFLPLKQTAVEIAARISSKKLNFADAVQKERENPFDDGTLGYYPFLSCFGGARARLNPGPTWVAPIDPAAWDVGRDSASGAARIPRPLSTRWDEFLAEEALLDESEEAEISLRLLKDKKADAERRSALNEKIFPGRNQKPLRGKARGRGKGARGVTGSRDTPGSSPGPGTPNSVLSQNPSRMASPAFTSVDVGTPASNGSLDFASETFPDRFGMGEDAEGETEEEDDEVMG